MFAVNCLPSTKQEADADRADEKSSLEARLQKREEGDKVAHAALEVEVARVKARQAAEAAKAAAEDERTAESQRHGAEAEAEKYREAHHRVGLVTSAHVKNGDAVAIEVHDGQALVRFKGALLAGMY